MKSARGVKPNQYMDEKDYILATQDREKYRSRKGEAKPAIHSGQRKLLMTEVQFLTNYWDPELHPNPVCLYIGASPGLHLDVMIPMFPEFEFILVDPQKTKVSVSHQDYSYEYRNQFFNDAEARKFAKDYADRNVFFICDIRTDPGNNSPLDIERMVWHEMTMQQKWVLLINPVACHLKCRFPWYDKIPDGYSDKDFAQAVEWGYLDGTIYIQPWATPTTTETRLVATRPYTHKYYDIIQYEEQMYHVNTAIRERARYLNPFTGDMSPCDSTECVPGYPELTNDFDSTLETIILSQYIQKRNEISPGAYTGEIENDVSNLSRHCTMMMAFGFQEDEKGKNKSYESISLVSLGLMRKVGLTSTAAINRLGHTKDQIDKVSQYNQESQSSYCFNQQTQLNNFPNWPSTETCADDADTDDADTDDADTDDADTDDECPTVPIKRVIPRECYEDFEVLPVKSPPRVSSSKTTQSYDRNKNTVRASTSSPVRASTSSPVKASTSSPVKASTSSPVKASSLNPKETMPKETMPKETMPKETMPKETMPKETMPKETMPKETMPKETTIRKPMTLNIKSVPKITTEVKPRRGVTKIRD